jgi:hypothetical protein
VPERYVPTYPFRITEHGRARRGTYPFRFTEHEAPGGTYLPSGTGIAERRHCNLPFLAKERNPGFEVLVKFSPIFH